MVLDHAEAVGDGLEREIEVPSDIAVLYTRFVCNLRL